MLSSGSRELPNANGFVLKSDYALDAYRFDVQSRALNIM